MTRQHGTVAGYNRIPCRDECCRSAYARYRKRLEWDKANGRPRVIQIVGTRRRVEALACLGWSQAEVARRAGMHPEHMPMLLRKDNVLATTAARIAEVYEALSTHAAPPGQSASYATGIARRRGWQPPEAWLDIDDPDEQPWSQQTPEVDPVVVDRILAGWPVPANRAERAEVVRRWIADGRSLGELERLTGWNSAREVRRVRAQDMTLEASA